MDLSNLTFEGVAQALVQAAVSGNYWYIVALLLVGAVYLLRTYGAKKIPFLASSAGGAILTILTSVAGAVFTAAGAGAPITGALLLAALKVAFGAAGGFSLVKNLVQSVLAYFKGRDAAAIKVAALNAGATAASAPVKSLEDIANGK